MGKENIKTAHKAKQDEQKKYKMSSLSQQIAALRLFYIVLGRVAQPVAHVTQKPEIPGSIPVQARGPGSIPVRPHTFISPSTDSRRAVISYWRKYVHLVLVKGLGGLSLPRNSAVRLTACHDNGHDCSCLP